jgi:hypothetical protein
LHDIWIHSGLYDVMFNIFNSTTSENVEYLPHCCVWAQPLS